MVMAVLESPTEGTTTYYEGINCSIPQLKCRLARKLAGVAAERFFCVDTLYDADDDEVDAEELADSIAQAEGSDAGQLVADARAYAEAFVRANSAWIEWMAIELFKRERISRWHLIRKFGHAVSEGTIERMGKKARRMGKKGLGKCSKRMRKKVNRMGKKAKRMRKRAEDEEEGEEDGEEGEEMEWE
ncbi:hypothetical protein niasHS_012850 [Heterodera schachtii]|uniref:Uncharacterized protein n=1 Tax=Heterodera schachtii TaxID=97005 RepID=A0ABD2IRJ4_HETSC